MYQQHVKVTVLASLNKKYNISQFHKTMHLAKTNVKHAFILLIVIYGHCYEWPYIWLFLFCVCSHLSSYVSTRHLLPLCSVYLTQCPMLPLSNCQQFYLYYLFAQLRKQTIFYWDQGAVDTRQGEKATEKGVKEWPMEKLREEEGAGRLYAVNQG